MTDKGPWTVEVWEGVIYVASGDFAHDAYLRVGGDFEDTPIRKKYAQEIADALNKAAKEAR